MYNENNGTFEAINLNTGETKVYSKDRYNKVRHNTDFEILWCEDVELF